MKRRKRSKIPKHQMPLVTGYDSSSDEEDEEKKNVAPKISSKKKKNTYVVSSLKLSLSSIQHSHTERRIPQRGDDESSLQAYQVTVTYRAAHVLGLE